MTVEYGSEFESDSAADRVTVTLYAKWTPNRYTIVYDANGGEGSMENTSASYGSDVPLRENTFTKDGAGLAGRNTAADGSGTSYADTAYIRIPDNIPTRREALFLSWAETPDATEAVYSYPAQEGTSETIVLRATVPNETAAKTLYAVWKENAPEGGTQGDAAGTQSVNEAPAALAPEPVQPEVPAEGDVKSSDTDKTEPPKAETLKSP